MEDILQNIRGVIFDLDGTLVDSNAAHAASWKKAIEGLNLKVKTDDILGLIGKGGDKITVELAEVERESTVGLAINTLRKNIFETTFLHDIRPFPGTAPLLEELKKRGIRIAIASSGEDEIITQLLQTAKIDDLIDVMTSSSDAENSKPDPDIVLSAIKKLKLPLTEIVMIGDTPYDIDAAIRAGLKAMAFRSERWVDRDLKGAIAIFDGPEDMLSKIASA